MKTIGCFLTLLALAGAAVAAKPEMTEEQYKQHAAMWVGIPKCNTAGHIDPALAAWGLTDVQTSASRYEFDQDRMRSLVAELENLEPSPENCRGAAMALAGRKQAVDQANRFTSSKPSWSNEWTVPLPKRTICNRVGGQTLCSTY